MIPLGANVKIKNRGLPEVTFTVVSFEESMLTEIHKKNILDYAKRHNRSPTFIKHNITGSHFWVPEDSLEILMRPYDPSQQPFDEGDI
jgi:hypothetical protein